MGIVNIKTGASLLFAMVALSPLSASYESFKQIDELDERHESVPYKVSFASYEALLLQYKDVAGLLDRAEIKKAIEPLAHYLEARRDPQGNFKGAIYPLLSRTLLTFEKHPFSLVATVAALRAAGLIQADAERKKDKKLSAIKLAGNQIDRHAMSLAMEGDALTAKFMFPGGPIEYYKKYGPQPK